MKGVLCRAVIMSDAHNQEFGVEVNQDHPSMQEAMKQRPINRMALLAWIVAEIGKELPFHPELLRRVVPKRMLDSILGENDREQGRIVTRLAHRSCLQTQKGCRLSVRTNPDAQRRPAWSAPG